MKYLHKLYFLFTTTLTFTEIHTISGPSCDPSSFSVPYVRVVKKRNGQDLDTINKSGFMDTTKYTQKILCINGPAVLYSHVDIWQIKGAVFSQAKLRVYQHECMIFNQIKTKKAIELRDKGIRDPTLFNVPDEFVMPGTMVTGVYLVSEPLDYLLPTSVMFRQHEWAYMFNSSNEQAEAGSFVTVGRGPFCLPVGKEFDIIVTGNEGQACKWTRADMNDLQFQRRYNKIFDGSRHISKMNEWSDCGLGAGVGLGPYGPPRPLTTSTIRPLDPFAIIMPQGVGSAGKQIYPNTVKINSGRKVDRNKSKVYKKGIFTNQKKLGSGLSDYDDDGTGNLEIFIDISACIPLPERLDPKNLPIECEPSDPSIADSILGLLHNLFAIPPPSDGSTPPQDITFKNIEEKKQINVAWKNVILDIASEIFSKICEPFEEEVPYTVSRLLEFFLARAHADNSALRTEPGVWEHLVGDLERCRNSTKTTHMLWYWDNQSELDDDIDNSPLDCMECKASKCTDGCTYDETQKLCTTLKDVCRDTLPKCKATNCKFDDSFKQCIKDIEDEEECNDEPSCPKGCKFDVGFGICTEPDCQVEICEPDNCCKVSMEKDKCELRGFVPGAFPSAVGGEDGRTYGASNMMNMMEEDDPTLASTITRNNPLFTKHWTQESFKARTNGGYNFGGVPENVLVITSIKNASAKGRSINFDDNGVQIMGECLFYYKDIADTHYELNIAIDIYWKMWTAVIGYCNSHYETRKSEVFPRLYNTFYEDFLEPIVEEWKYPKFNEVLRIILSDLNSERSQKWLDVCLESSYVYSKSPTYRPPRPLLVGEKDSLQPNYFQELPDYIQAKFKPVNLADPNQIIRCQ